MVSRDTGSSKKKKVRQPQPQTTIKCTDPSTRGELGKVCAFVCFCNDNFGFSSSGGKLKQMCVDSIIHKYNEYLEKNGQKSRIASAPPYAVFGKKALPCFETIDDLRDTNFFYKLLLVRVLAQVTSDETAEQSLEFYFKYMRRELTFEELKVKAGFSYDDLPAYAKGELRMPDTVITAENSPSLYPEDGITVGEIKFPGDDWGEEQYSKYLIIANNNKKKLEELNVTDCECAKPLEQHSPEFIAAAALLPTFWDDIINDAEEMAGELAWTAASLAPVGRGLKVLKGARDMYERTNSLKFAPYIFKELF